MMPRGASIRPGVPIPIPRMGWSVAVSDNADRNQYQQQVGQIAPDIRSEHMKVVQVDSTSHVEIRFRGCTFPAGVSWINGKYYPSGRQTGVVITQANLPRVAAANGCA